MNYTTNSHNRKLKYKLHLLADRLSFNFLNLSSGYKTALLGNVLLFIALFFTWILIPSETGDTRDFSAFSVHTGYVGYIFLGVILFLSIIILSNTNREKLKSRTRIIFPDHTIIIFSGVITFLLSFVIFNTTRSLNMLVSSTATAGKGLIFAFIGSLFIIFGGILAYRAEKKELLEKMYVTNAQDYKSDLEEYEHILGKKDEKGTDNMSLPI